MITYQGNKYASSSKSVKELEDFEDLDNSLDEISVKDHGSC